jgi:hypothetical protein
VSRQPERQASSGRSSTNNQSDTPHTRVHSSISLSHGSASMERMKPQGEQALSSAEDVAAATDAAVRQPQFAHQTRQSCAPVRHIIGTSHPLVVTWRALCLGNGLRRGRSEPAQLTARLGFVRAEQARARRSSIGHETGPATDQDAPPTTNFDREG